MGYYKELFNQERVLAELSEDSIIRKHYETEYIMDIVKYDSSSRLVLDKGRTKKQPSTTGDKGTTGDSIS